MPQQVAYFGDEKLIGEKRFVAETSNGCALGGSLEEAMLFGLFEVLERDAFLLKWHAKLPVPAIDLSTINDDRIYAICERIRSLGFQVYLFNTTTEFGIPCVAAYCVNNENRAPRFFVAGGCHLQPIRAVAGCLKELAAHAQIAHSIYSNRRKRVEELKGNPKKILQLEDHYLYYYHPQHFNVTDFLFKREIPYLSFDKAFYEHKIHSINLTNELKSVISRIQKYGYEVIVVDQTPEIYREIGLFAVKMIIPGILQLGFGHYGSRALTQKRLREAPVTMGYATKPLSSNQLNHAPHPFP